MVRIMEKLGRLYYLMGKMSQSEHWYRRVITARQQLADTNSVEALQTRLDLIDAIIDQGRWVEAKKLHQEIYPSILDKVNPNHGLVQQSLKILARISTRLDDEEEAETFSRQLLQLRLNSFGPWNVRTLIAMQLLATPLRNKAIYAECEDLLRIVLQLQGRVHDTSDHSKCVAIASLAEVLFYQKRYKEGKPLFKRAAELAEYSLGGEHPVSLYCNYLLARSLHMEGLLIESKELLEANLEKQIRLLGETEINTTNAMSELGEIFMERGCYKEATIWLEKAFRGVAPVFGVEHNYSISICGALGICYEKQERYTDAVALYKKTMQEITATKGSDHLALVKLQRWIDWNRDRLALPEEEKEHCVSGQSHLTVPSDCPVYSAIYKPQRYMLNIG